MKKSCLTGLAALTVIAALSSCSTLSHEAATVNVDSKIVSTTVGDMDVSKQKATATVNWNWSPFSAIKPSEIQQQAAAQLLRDNNADVIVEPVYETHRRGLFRGGTVTVTGYTAVYTNFRPMREHEELNLNKSRICKTTETKIVRPGSFLGSKKAPKPKREKKEFNSSSFLDITTGVNVLKITDSDYYDESQSYTTGTIGLTYGHYCVNRWGWYVRANFDFGAGYNDDHYKRRNDYYGYNSNYEPCTETHRQYAGTVGAGALFALSNKVGIFAGAGLGAQVCDYMKSGRIIRYHGCEVDDEHYGYVEFALPIEVGFNFRFGAVNAMIGYRHTFLPGIEDNQMSTPIIGIGVNF